MTATRSNTWNAAGTESVIVYNYGFYNVTGQSNYLDNEYVSVGVLPSPYHGAGTTAGADGCKWFSTDKNGNGIPSIRGYRSEPGRTNNLRQSRDLSLPAAGTTTGVKCWFSDAYGSELVTNGDFSGGLTGWTNTSSGSGTATLGGGGVQMSGTNSSNRGAIEQLITGVDPTKMYMLQVNISSFTSGQLTMSGRTRRQRELDQFTSRLVYILRLGTGDSKSRLASTNGDRTWYIKVMTSGNWWGCYRSMTYLSNSATINAVEDATGTGLDGLLPVQHRG
jgi:hypothetical protein